MMSPNPAAMARHGPLGGLAGGPPRGNPGVQVSSRSASMTSRCSPGLSAVSPTLTWAVSPPGGDPPVTPRTGGLPAPPYPPGGRRSIRTAGRYGGATSSQRMLSGGAGLRLIRFGHSMSLPGVRSSSYRPPRSSVTVNSSNGIRPGRRRVRIPVRTGPALADPLGRRHRPTGDLARLAV